ncbi:hypothetical protein [Halomonas getboli]|uniref:hypothetical protein n=1 Tax=Halomonas getboli TaxID=2935862 RepID=UPI001FFF31EE|nr:hypothetical protein [Halomonas getboli]MCK2185707.1 hypothetical protein [Halomonas getboli]
MSDITSYLHTSVSDAKISLEGHIKSSPQTSASLALVLLKHLRGSEGQKSRQKMLASVLRKSAKALAESDELDPNGTRAGDDYAEMPTGELRGWVDRMVAKDPGRAAGEMVDTLTALRGEYGTTSRRKILAAGVGKAAKALAEGDDHGAS